MTSYLFGAVTKLDIHRPYPQTKIQKLPSCYREAEVPATNHTTANMSVFWNWQCVVTCTCTDVSKTPGCFYYRVYTG